MVQTNQCGKEITNQTLDLIKEKMIRIDIKQISVYFITVHLKDRHHDSFLYFISISRYFYHPQSFHPSSSKRKQQ